jgi:hypothetical protein
MGAS